MKQVAKYNLFKLLSVLITCIPTLLVSYHFTKDIVKDPGQSISLAGVIGIIVVAAFMKDKIAENFKMPSPFIVSTIIFIFVIVIEKILVGVKFTCLSAMIFCAIDELIFKRIYKRLDMLMPENKEVYKHFGFYFCKTETLFKKSRGKL